MTSCRRLVVKIIAESLSQHDEKHVVPTPLSVGKEDDLLFIASVSINLAVVLYQYENHDFLLFL
jgi:hypothetical protein